jgi:hypothetical protein
VDRATFDERLDRVVVAITQGGQIDALEYAQVIDHLERWVAKAFPTVAPDAEDVVADAVAGLLRAVSAGSEFESAPGYLISSVRNAALDRIRRASRTEAVAVGTEIASETAGDFDAAIVERVVSRAQVASALRAAVTWRPDGGANGDVIAVRVLAAFLDLATEGTPSTREVAGASAVRHVTVLRVYAQVRAYLEDPSGGWVPRSALRRR